MKTDELADHLFASMLGAFDMLTIHLGDQFGVYALLHRHGPLTEAEVSQRSGMDARYAREWLEQQTVAGIITVDDPARPAEERRYALPDEHAAVLADPDNLSYFAPFARLVAATAAQMPALVEAYRTGGGVGWAQYGELMRTAQAEANRPLFLGILGSEWLPSVDDVHERLTAGGAVADIGCGDGWSSIGIALAYPEATVVGIDVDEASVAAAHQNAASYDVDSRVTFTNTDGAEAQAQAGYDLVTAFECIHDMPDPVSVLAGARRMVKDDGAVIVMDEKVADAFAGPGDPVEQLMYGYSTLVCLPDGLSHKGSVGTGTVMRAGTLTSYAVQAGFSGVDVLPIDHEMFRFYRLQL